MTACRWCAAGDVDVVLDLGQQPAADAFPRPGQTVPLTPLRLGHCPRCGLTQLIEDPGTVEEPLGVEPQALVEQATDAVTRLVADGIIRPGTTCVEFGSPHGGSWTSQLEAAGAVAAGREERADVVVDVFGFMHEPDQRAGLQRRLDRLAPGGILLLQFQPLRGIVTGGQWNAVRHGHFAYYDAPVLTQMLADVGFAPGHRWDFDLYGLTTLLSATQGTDSAVADSAVEVGALRGLARQARDTADDLRAWLSTERAAGRRVMGYAAASRTVPLLNFAHVGPELLPVVLDGSPAKHGREIPGVGVPIGDPAQLRHDPPDVVLLFVPDLLDEIRRLYPEVEASGGHWAVDDPTVRLVPSTLGV